VIVVSFNFSEPTASQGDANAGDVRKHASAPTVHSIVRFVILASRPREYTWLSKG
jgi:hypothetical protein